MGDSGSRPAPGGEAGTGRGPHSYPRGRVHSMRKYQYKLGGYTVRQRLSDEDAKRLGLLAGGATQKEQEAAPVVETAKAEPANRQQPRGGGRGGRKLNRD